LPDWLRDVPWRAYVKEILRRHVLPDICLLVYNLEMAEEINTHSVGRGFVTSDDVVLSQTARTRIIFRPGIHRGGVRGHLIRQKIGENGQWADFERINFNSLPADAGVQIELDTEATQNLYAKLTNLYQVQGQGIAPGDHHYVVGERDEVVVVNDRNKARVIEALLEQNASEEFWTALTEADPDLATRLAAGRIQYDRECVIRDFETALTKNPDDEAFWQNFFETNHWILQAVFSGAVYLMGSDIYIGGKGPVGRQGAGGVATDFLFSDDSTKSFSVVEIKTPDTQLVGRQYRGSNQDGHNNETYTMHSELSGGVVQTRNQISTAIESFEGVLGAGFEHKMNRVHPKGVLISGKLDGLNERQLASFNHFRHGQYSLTIITYDEVLKRLKLLFGMHNPEAATDEQPQNSDEPDESINLDDIPF